MTRGSGEMVATIVTDRKSKIESPPNGTKSRSSRQRTGREGEKNEWKGKRKTLS